MDTKAKGGKKLVYVSEATGQLVVFTPEFIQGIVDNIPKIDVLGPANEDSERLSLIAPEPTREILNRIQERDKSHVIESGPIEMFAPEDVRRAISQIREAEVTAPSTGEILWSKILTAKPFAQKLFVAALKEKQLDECYADLKKTAELSKDAEMVTFLEDTEVSFQEKTELLSYELGGINNLVLSLVYLLIRNHMLKVLTDIAKEYTHLYKSHDSVVIAKVTTAISLDDEDILKISNRLSDIIGKKVIPELLVEPDLIGGIVIRIGDKILDGSIRGKMESIKRVMVGGKSDSQAQTQKRQWVGQSLWKTAKKKSGL